MLKTVVVSKITSKGQVTVPENIRKSLLLQQGDYLEWSTRGTEEVVLRRIRQPLQQLVGLLRKPQQTKTLWQIKKGLTQHFRKAYHGRR